MVSKKEILGILNKLTPDERAYLAQLDPETLIQLLTFIGYFVKDELLLLQKIRNIPRREVRQTLTEDEYDRYEALVKDNPDVKKIWDIDPKLFDIGMKLSRKEFDTLETAAINTPQFFELPKELLPPKVPEEKVPPVEIPPEEPEYEEEIEEVIKKIEIEEEAEAIAKQIARARRIPVKWRSIYPFLTVTFIKSFLEQRKEAGAYPYEVYKAFVAILWKLLTDEQYRIQSRETGQLLYDGAAIDGTLTTQWGGLELDKMFRICPGMHIARYDSIWRYFMILNFLGLIQKKERILKKEVEEGETLPAFDTRQLYTLNESMYDTIMWARGWERPQYMMYPLASVGRTIFNRLKKRAAKKNITIGEAYIDYIIDYWGGDKDDIERHFTEWADAFDVPPELIYQCIKTGNYKPLRYPDRLEHPLTFPFETRKKIRKEWETKMIIVQKKYYIS